MALNVENEGWHGGERSDKSATGYLHRFRLEAMHSATYEELSPINL